MYGSRSQLRKQELQELPKQTWTSQWFNNLYDRKQSIMTEKIFIDRLTSQYYLNHYKYKNLIFNANLSSLCSVTYHAAAPVTTIPISSSCETPSNVWFWTPTLFMVNECTSITSNHKCIWKSLLNHWTTNINCGSFELHQLSVCLFED